MVEPVAAQQLVSPQSQVMQYGILGIGIVVFAGVIVFLFKQYQKQIKRAEVLAEAVAEERKVWAVERERTARDHAVERERLNTETEERHAALVVEYAKKIEEEHKTCREREDAIREDYDAKTTARSDEMRRAQDAIATMLDKLTDRLVFSRTGGGRH